MEAIWTPETPNIKQKGCDSGAPDTQTKNKERSNTFLNKNIPRQTHPPTHAPPAAQGWNEVVGSRASVKEFQMFLIFCFADGWPLLKSPTNDYPMVRAVFLFQKFSSLRICEPSNNPEKLFFWATLEPQGPRDPPCVKARKILFRIALTRGLRDQMAPQ